MELELKHITPYLPYNLKVLSGDSSVIYNLVGLERKNNLDYYLRDIQIKGEDRIRTYNQLLKYCKPVLKPLSDIINVIEILAKIEDKSFNRKIKLINGAAYKRIKYVDDDGEVYSFAYYILKNSFSFLDKNGSNIEMMHTCELYNKLFELHFDIFGLIEKGLAVDMNCL